MKAAIIETERLVLHPLRVEDAEEMADVLSDERLHEFTGGRPATLPELRERYRRLAAGRSPDGTRFWLNWIVRLQSDGSAVGTVQATVVPGSEAGPRATIAWVVGSKWQRQGIASEAARGLVAWLQAQGVTSMSANVHPQHLASQRVASRAGFRPTTEENDGEQVWRRP